MLRSAVFALALASAAFPPLAAGPLTVSSSITGGSPHLLSGGPTQYGGFTGSLTMLSADPASPLFSLSGSAYAAARPGELIAQTVAVASGAGPSPGQLSATASAAYSDTLLVQAPGLDGASGFFVFIWPEPELVFQATAAARACPAPCAGVSSMRLAAPGYFEIGRIPFLFGQPFEYSLALHASASVAWLPGGKDGGDEYAYAAAIAGLDAAHLLAGVVDARGRLLTDADWFSQAGLLYAPAPPELIHSPEPRSLVLLATALALFALRALRPAP